MAIMSTNLIRPVTSGLDNLGTTNFNNSLNAGGMVNNNLSSISQPTINNPASIGISNLFINNNLTTNAAETNTLDEDIQSLAKSVNTQEARIAAGTSTNIAEQYLQDEEEDKDNLITKVLKVLDAPRNALMNGFNYVTSNYEGGFFEGFWEGLTYNETYTGYDFAEDYLGLEEGTAGNVIAGFASEVFLDPLNWITWGSGSFAKGFAQGAITDVAQETAEQTVKTGIREMGQQAIKDGSEEAAQSLVTSGIKGTEKAIAKRAGQELSNEAATQMVKQQTRGAGGLLNSLASKLDEVENTFGLTFGNGKLQAAYKQAISVASDTGRLAGGLTDDVLSFARAGNYGDELQQLAEQFVKSKQALIGADDVARGQLNTTIKSLKDELLDKLQPYKLELRYDALAAKGVDASALKQGISSMYEDTMVGALKSLESKNGVNNVADLLDELTRKTGQEVTERNLYTLMAKEGFGERALSSLNDNFLRYGNIDELRTSILDNLIDTVAADQLYNNALKTGMKELGTGFGFSVPFSSIRRDIADANTMFELGAKARTLIGTKITAKGLEPTLAGRVLDDIGKGIGAIFGHLPVIGKAMDEANRLEKTNRWAIKFIEQSTKGQARLAATTAENSIEAYYKVLKDAGFNNSDELEDVGNFVSRAIESKQLGKNETIAEWLTKIKGFTEMDDTTINNRVSEQLLNIEQEFRDNPNMLVDEFGNTLGDSFDDYYNKMKTGLTSELKTQSDLKNILLSYDEKKQRAMLEVTKGIADDFDKIGRDLVELRLIPDNRMLEAEYWYFPHKMSLDLMLENNMDIDRTIGTIRTAGEAAEDVATGTTRGMRNILGGRTERFTLRNVSSWQRKYPMSTVEVNKILQNKYGIDHMLETNAFNTYLLYALDQGKVIADANEVNEILNTFGIRVNSRDIVPALRTKGYTIVTRNSNVNAMQVSEKTMGAIESYNARAKQYNDLLKRVRGSSRDLTRAQRQADVTMGQVARQLDINQGARAEARAVRNEMKDLQNTAIKKAKEIATDSDYLQDLVNKGVFPEGVDIDTLREIIESKANNPFGNGNYIYAVDSLGNQEMPQLMATNALKNQDGLPQVFVGNADDIANGFRQVPNDTSIVPDNEDLFYIVSKNPVDIQVDDIQLELSYARNRYTEEMKQAYRANGYDSIRLMDANGNQAVIPFDETNVFYRNKLKEADYADKYWYARYYSNTTNGGRVNPKNAFNPDDTIINVKDIKSRNRRALSKLLDEDYTRINAAQRERETILNSVNREYDSAVKELDDLINQRDYIMENAQQFKIPEDAQRQLNELDEAITLKQGNIETLANQSRDITKRMNNVTSSRQYNFIAGLKKAKGFDTTADAYLTAEELYNMLGSNKESGLMLLGYDAVIDHVDDTGKIIYKALPNADVITKKEMADGFDVISTLLKTNSEADDMVSLLTDIGAGRDSMAKMVEKYANKDMISSLDSMKKRLQKVVDINTAGIEELETLPLARQYTKSQSNLIARMASSDNFLTEVLDEQSINDLFAITDTMTAMTKTDRDIWALPSNIVEYLNKGIRKQTDQGVSLLKDIMYKFNKIWKPSVTAWRPSFGVRNLMSGYFNSFMYAGMHIFDPDITRASLNMVTGKNLDEVIELGGKEYTLNDIKKLMIANGASNGLVVTDVNSIGEMLATQLKKATDPSYVSPVRHPLRTMTQINAGVEDYNRSLLYMAALKNGETAEYAGDLVRRLQFDYADLSDFEKKIKTVMPFYTWMRNNIPLQVERFMDDPRMYMVLMKRVPDAGKEASGMTDEEWNNIPSWVKNTFPIALGKDPETGRYRLFDTTLPYQDLANIGDVETMFGEVVSLLHPMVKIPMELFLNKNLYTGAALESYEGETAEQSIKGTANPVLNAIAKVAPNALRSMPRCYCYI